MGVGGRRHTSAASPPGKRLGTHCTGGWVHPVPVWRVWRGENLSPPPRFEPHTVQRLPNRYSEYAIPARTSYARRNYCGVFTAPQIWFQILHHLMLIAAHKLRMRTDMDANAHARINTFFATIQLQDAVEQWLS